MKYSKALASMTKAAKAAGVPLAEICARQIKDNPSKIREFLLVNGIHADKNPAKMGAQAGKLIHSQASASDLKRAYDATACAAPKDIQAKPWYKLLKSDPAGFAASCCLYEDTASNFSGTAVSLKEAASYADGAQGAKVPTTGKGSGIDLTAIAGGNANAIDSSIALSLAAFGVPIPANLIHTLGNYVGNLVSSIGVGENGRDLPGGWIEYWKYFKNQPLYGQEPKNTPVSIGYWRGTWYPNQAAEMKAGGFNPPPNPAKGDEAGIADATVFLGAMNELFKRYYLQVRDMTNGMPEVWAKIKALALADGLKIPNGKKAAQSLQASFMPGDTGSGSGSGGYELPEIGGVKTPWGNISWGVTNNKAVITYLVIAAVAVVAIIYFTRKSK